MTTEDEVGQPPMGRTFEDLLRVVATLRDPGGCPWDAEQTHESLRPYLLEETYEALEAMEGGGPEQLSEELGDLLTHMAFHIDIAVRAGEFDAADVVSGVIDKLVRRHPHVFREAVRRCGTPPRWWSGGRT